MFGFFKVRFLIRSRPLIIILTSAVFLPLLTEAKNTNAARTTADLPALMPFPHSIRLTQDKFRLDEKFSAGVRNSQEAESSRG